MRRALHHQKMNANTDRHYPSICTVQLVTYSTTAANQQKVSGYTNVPGVTNVACILGPVRADRPADNEIRTDKAQTTVLLRTCKLNGLHTAIVPRNHVAVVDTVRYLIRGVEFDYLRLNTRLRLEVVQPDGR